MTTTTTRAMIVCSDGKQVNMPVFAFVSILAKHYNRDDVRSQFAVEGAKYWMMDFKSDELTFNAVVAGSGGDDGFGEDDFKVICLGALSLAARAVMFINANSHEVLKWLADMSVSYNSVTQWGFVGRGADAAVVSCEVTRSKLLYTSDGECAVRAVYRAGKYSHTVLNHSASSVWSDIHSGEDTHPTLVLLVAAGLEAA